ncbi:transcription factor Adf-1-like isoform X2 [Notolabrus celidotus]|uniref:transcription factor Adf-1-like isoform X2 n=1 Tax=Notolabrus celidotus TaxID=1203425 RepID=UPI00148FA397|nr:transcription factor Adf-1-like isoform X2 [Notolabrus celidotus]
MDEEKFILEVEQHKIIYDTTNPFYKDNIRKEKAWTEIAGVLELDVEVCKARWKTLRDAFVKSKKRGNMPSGSAGGSQKEWKYAEIMSFLLPHIQQRSSRSNLKNVLFESEGRERSGTPQSLGEYEEQSSASGAQQTTAASPSPSPSLTSTSRDTDMPSRSRSPRDRPSTSGAQAAKKDTRHSHRPTSVDIGDRLISILEEPVPKPHMPDNELDESYYFALSLVPMLHRLDKDRRQEAKIEMLRTLHNLYKGQQQATTIPHTASWQTIHAPTQQSQPPPTITGHSSQATRPVSFRPVTHPPQYARPIGQFTQMLASSDPQWEDRGTGGDFFEDL